MSRSFTLSLPKRLVPSLLSASLACAGPLTAPASTWYQEAPVTLGIDIPADGFWGTFSLIDFNNDGLEDLYVAGSGPAPGYEATAMLYLNQGNGTFSNILSSTHPLALVSSYPAFSPSTAEWGDPDGDGDLDLFLSNWTFGSSATVSNHHLFFRNDGNLSFTEMAVAAGLSGIGENYNMRSYTANWLDVNGDGLLDLNHHIRDGANVLYRNLGNLNFSNVTDATSVSAFGSGLAANWCDFDNDGLLDVFISGVERGPTSTNKNRLLKQNANGIFTDVTASAGLILPAPPRGNIFAPIWMDYDNDGNFDLFLPHTGSVTFGYTHKLYRNLGNGTFADVSVAAGLGNTPYMTAPAVADLNNDGWLDMVVGKHPAHSDFPNDDDEELQTIFINNGNGTFTEFNTSASQAQTLTGITTTMHVGPLVVGDFNQDGRLDMAMADSHGDEPAVVYLNQNLGVGNSYLRLRLQEPTGNNRFAIGARVTVSAGSLAMSRQVGIGDRFVGNQPSLIQHFGLGSNTAGTVTVRWPDGTIESFGSKAANQLHTLVKGSGQARASEWAMYE
jgi:hypothetical protein